MRAIVINLASATERMAFQTRQIARLGLELHRLEAFDSTNAATQHRSDYWETWQRPLKDTEKACLLSHRSAWELVAEINKPALILEDDAVLSFNSTTLLKQLEAQTNLDLVNLEVRGRKKMVAKHHLETDPTIPIRRLYQDRTGAAAYVLWPTGARKLLARSERVCGLADAVIAAAYELRAYQADPALAVQIDRCELYGVKEPIFTQSSIGSTKPHSLPAEATKQYFMFKFRRIFAQLRMGMRQFVKAPVAVRRHITLDKSGFDQRQA